MAADAKADPKPAPVLVLRPVVRCPDGADSWVPLPCDDAGNEVLPTRVLDVHWPERCPSCRQPVLAATGHKVEMASISSSTGKGGA